MEREQFKNEYSIVYKDFYGTTDANTGEKIMLLRSEVFAKNNPVIPEKTIVEKVVIDRHVEDLGLMHGKEAVDEYFMTRMNLKIDLTYNIED